MGKPLRLTDKNFEQEVLESSLPVLVDFWASWCPPCKMVDPVVAKLAAEYDGRLKVGKLNVDRNPRTAQRYDVVGLPTFAVFQAGEMAVCKTGARSERQLRTMLQRVLRAMHVLVTGGAGFIGANLVRLLLDEGYRVRVLDNLSTGRREYLDGLDLEFVEGDILDVEVVNQAVANVDGVVHLAAQTGVPGSLQDPRRDCKVNVIGTLNLLEACRYAEVGRFVFASSNAPLGRQPPPAREDKAPLPISPYGASKLAGEGYCLAYHGSWGLGTVVLRFANVYGTYSAHKNSVVAKFFKDILAKGEITIDGDGEQTRDFIYVDDLCRAVLLALESDASGEVFQIATGVETSIRELAEMVQEGVGSSGQVHHGPARQGDIRKNYSAVNKARQVLGWQPTMRLKDGLQRTWAWFQALGE